MSYVLFVYDTPSSTLTPEEEQAVYYEYAALAEIPGLLGHRLQPPQTDTTLRVSNGQRTAAAWPPEIATNYLAGFYLLDTDDADHALAIAARIPAARLGGAIHVHRLVDEP